jgi:hypothetical protein
MQVFLVRVGADLSLGGGTWNGPVDSSSGRFVYTPIPERKAVRPGLAKPYATLSPFLAVLGVSLPKHLAQDQMHLDPDFEHGTYGDTGRKGAQLAGCLISGDRLVFYSGLKDTRSNQLVYGLIGTILVKQVTRATEWPSARYDQNAHTRRVLSNDAADIVVVGSPESSGRLSRCIPIGEYRDRAYRLRQSILEAWGPLSARDGYLQRSAVFPSLKEPARFTAWWDRQEVQLVRANNVID